MVEKTDFSLGTLNLSLHEIQMSKIYLAQRILCNELYFVCEAKYIVRYATSQNKNKPQLNQHPKNFRSPKQNQPIKTETHRQQNDFHTLYYYT